MSRAADILIRPVVTEKTTAAMAENKYTFLVDPRANKNQIKRAVEEAFGVKVRSVNTIRQLGKMRRLGVFRGRRPGYKKAVVTLEEGERIKVFEDMS